MTQDQGSAGTIASTGSRPADIKAVPVRHPGRWVAVAAIAVLVAMLVHGAFFAHVVRGNSREQRIEWSIVGKYLFTSEVMHGVLVTLELTVIAMVIGIVGGVVLAVMRLSANPVLSGAGWVYVWFFRGTPVLVQLLFWYVGVSYMFQAAGSNPPVITIGVPFGPALFHMDLNTWITPFVAVAVGLGLNEAAYMSEIVRAGVLAVDEGQTEAAQSLGMTRALTMRRIVLPQAMRVIIPPTGNELISMLKTSSLAYIASVSELAYTVKNIYSNNYETIPLLIVASLWYIGITTVLTVGQYYVERFYAKGSVRTLPPTPLQRFRAMLLQRRVLPPPAVDLQTLAGPAQPGGWSQR